MKSKRLAIWFALAAALSPALARAAEDSGHEQILAHGTDKSLWVVYALPGDSAAGTEARSAIRVESFPEAKWKRLSSLGGQAVALADRNGQLIAAFDNGQWVQVDPFASQRAIPGTQDILALAASDGVVWAISYGQLTRQLAATTAPTTTQSATPTTMMTASATAPALLPPLLFCLAGRDWQALAALPVASPPKNANQISLTVAGSSPQLALLDQNVIRTYRFVAAEARWQPTGTAQSPFAVRQLKLLAAADHLILFYAGDHGRYEMRVGNPEGRWAEPTSLEAPPEPAAVFSMTAALAAGQVHILAAAHGTKGAVQFFEQICAPDGKVVGHFAPLAAPAGSGEPSTLWSWVDVIVATALVMLMFDAVRRRRARPLVVLDPAQIVLAPLGTRLLAGIIDMIPLAAVMVGYVSLHAQTAAEVNALLRDPSFPIWAILAKAAYIAVAALTECLAGRSLGKMITGLDIVSIDGTRPKLWPLALRNLMRWVDLYLAMAPLALIFFSPLHMRLGDAAAGTLVVNRGPAQE